MSMRRLPSVEIPRRILNDLYAHAIQSLPEECCGLIVGTDEDRFERLVRCRNEMTMRHRQDPVEYPRDGTEAFYMNSLDYMIVYEEAEARGARVTAVYHSHVGVGAYFSGMDLDYAESENFPFPDADHIVVAIFDRKVDSVGFLPEGMGTASRFSGARSLRPNHEDLHAPCSLSGWCSLHPGCAGTGRGAKRNPGRSDRVHLSSGRRSAPPRRSARNAKRERQEARTRTTRMLRSSI